MVVKCCIPLQVLLGHSMINNIVNVTEVISLVKGSVSEWGMPAKLLRLTKQAGVAVVLRFDKVTWGGAVYFSRDRQSGLCCICFFSVVQLYDDFTH